MPTPKKGYYIDKTRVPNVTTILSRFKDSGPLMYWAFKQGASGAATLYEERDKAADIGRIVHEYIERHINGETVTVDVPEAAPAFRNYLEWEKQTNIKFISKFQEIQLVCPKYRFGGTPDAIGIVNDRPVLIDWKTSNGVYVDYLIQCAAYVHLVNNGVRMDTGEPLGIKLDWEAFILRLPKMDGEEAEDLPCDVIDGVPEIQSNPFATAFSFHHISQLDVAFKQFVLFRNAYALDQKLKTML
jgi:hypothetical protein